MRISKGNCGGYKTKVRKPSKELRHNRIKIVIISSIFTIIFLGTTIFCLAKASKITNFLGTSLIDKNNFQYQLVNKLNQDSISARIKFINQAKYEVKNSDVNFEYFKVGYFLKTVVKEYKKSLDNSIEFRKNFF